MLRIVTTYIFVLVLLSLGFFGVGALASAAALADTSIPTPVLQQFRDHNLLPAETAGARLIDPTNGRRGAERALHRAAATRR